MKKQYAPYHPTSAEMLLLVTPANETQESAIARLKSLNRLYSQLLKNEIDTTLVRNASAKIRSMYVTGEKGYKKTVKTSAISTKAELKNCVGTFVRILTSEK